MQTYNTNGSAYLSILTELALSQPHLATRAIVTVLLKLLGICVFHIYMENSDC
jgi:hypothetical protein